MLIGDADERKALRIEPADVGVIGPDATLEELSAHHDSLMNWCLRITEFDRDAIEDPEITPYAHIISVLHGLCPKVYQEDGLHNVANRLAGRFRKTDKNAHMETLLKEAEELFAEVESLLDVTYRSDIIKPKGKGKPSIMEFHSTRHDQVMEKISKAIAPEAPPKHDDSTWEGIKEMVKDMDYGIRNLRAPYIKKQFLINNVFIPLTLLREVLSVLGYPQLDKLNPEIISEAIILAGAIVNSEVKATDVMRFMKFFKEFGLSHTDEGQEEEVEEEESLASDISRSLVCDEDDFGLGAIEDDFGLGAIEDVASPISHKGSYIQRDDEVDFIRTSTQLSNMEWGRIGAVHEELPTCEEDPGEEGTEDDDSNNDRTSVKSFHESKKKDDDDDHGHGPMVGQGGTVIRDDTLQEASSASTSDTPTSATNVQGAETTDKASVNNFMVRLEEDGLTMMNEDIKPEKSGQKAGEIATGEIKSAVDIKVENIDPENITSEGIVTAEIKSAVDIKVENIDPENITSEGIVTAEIKSAEDIKVENIDPESITSAEIETASTVAERLKSWDSKWSRNLANLKQELEVVEEPIEFLGEDFDIEGYLPLPEHMLQNFKPDLAKIPRNELAKMQRCSMKWYKHLQTVLENEELRDENFLPTVGWAKIDYLKVAQKVFQARQVDPSPMLPRIDNHNLVDFQAWADWFHHSKGFELERGLIPVKTNANTFSFYNALSYSFTGTQSRSAELRHLTVYNCITKENLLLDSLHNLGRHAKLYDPHADFFDHFHGKNLAISNTVFAAFGLNANIKVFGVAHAPDVKYEAQSDKRIQGLNTIDAALNIHFPTVHLLNCNRSRNKPSSKDTELTNHFVPLLEASSVEVYHSLREHMLSIYHKMEREIKVTPKKTPLKLTRDDSSNPKSIDNTFKRPLMASAETEMSVSESTTDSLRVDKKESTDEKRMPSQDRKRLSTDLGNYEEDASPIKKITPSKIASESHILERVTYCKKDLVKDEPSKQNQTFPAASSSSSTKLQSSTSQRHLGIFKLENNSPSPDEVIHLFQTVTPVMDKLPTDELYVQKVMAVRSGEYSTGKGKGDLTDSGRKARELFKDGYTYQRLYIANQTNKKFIWFLNKRDRVIPGLSSDKYSNTEFDKKLAAARKENLLYVAGTMRSKRTKHIRRIIYTCEEAPNDMDYLLDKCLVIYQRRTSDMLDNDSNVDNDSKVDNSEKVTAIQETNKSHVAESFKATSSLADGAGSSKASKHSVNHLTNVWKKLKQPAIKKGFYTKTKKLPVDNSSKILHDNVATNQVDEEQDQEQEMEKEGKK